MTSNPVYATVRNVDLTFDTLVERTEEDANGCWIWLGGTDGKNGYGVLRAGTRTVRAHIAMFETLHGKVPVGLELDHTCRVPLCINPSHLEAVTHRVNIRRAKGWTELEGIWYCPQGHAMNEYNERCEANNRVRCLACKKSVNRKYYRSRYENYV